MKLIVTTEKSAFDALAALAPGASKTSMRSWLASGRVLLNGAPVKKGAQTVTPGDTISLTPKHKAATLKILFQDEHIVVIDKPAGLLSVSTHYETKKTAHAYLKELHRPNMVYPVHRLDRETSGVMLFALSSEARDRLKDVFEKHGIKREYEAIVEGHFDAPKGRLESLLVEDANYRVHSHPTQGKKAVTHYEVLSERKQTSHVKFTLETGRKNQIRVHCQDAGHPILGDKKYGGRMKSRRLQLHAAHLAFKHPITGKKLNFHSPL